MSVCKKVLTHEPQAHGETWKLGKLGVLRQDIGRGMAGQPDGAVSLHSHSWLPWIGLLDVRQDEKPRLITADVLLGVFEERTRISPLVLSIWEMRPCRKVLKARWLGLLTR